MADLGLSSEGCVLELDLEILNHGAIDSDCCCVIVLFKCGNRVLYFAPYLGETGGISQLSRQRWSNLVVVLD